MAVKLHFNVTPGDIFHYQWTFKSPSGTNTHQSSEQIVETSPNQIQVVDPDDPDGMVSVLDWRGRPVDFLQAGASIKDELADDVWDISNRLIFPESEVNPGDTWQVDDGRVRVSYKLIGVGPLNGREAAEIHATAPGYTGPIKYWVELATGQQLREEYQVGTTKTTIERL